MIEHKMRYRLAIDLGAKSMGWAMFRLDANKTPVAIIKTGVRIFSDGRDPQKKASLAVTRRLAKSARKTRDRKIKRKSRMLAELIHLGFMPRDKLARKKLELLDPYVLRQKGLTQKLSPEEFGRALFHLTQRRGYKSNRKTDKSAESNAEQKPMLSAISELQEIINDKRNKNREHKTIGDYLATRKQKGLSVRARFRENIDINSDTGKEKKNKKYDLYVNRDMVEYEFDELWRVQSNYNPKLFTQKSKIILKDILLFQRRLRPIKPGRCSLDTEQERAPRALPSVQRFRILEELNNLKVVNNDFTESDEFSLEQRNILLRKLEACNHLTFTQIKKALNLPLNTKLNFEDGIRDRLQGNITNVKLSDNECFGKEWLNFPMTKKDEVVKRLIDETSEKALINYLESEFSLNNDNIQNIIRISLPEGYRSLSCKVINEILPKLENSKITYNVAAEQAGYNSSALSHFEQTGEIMERLPYYGIPLERHIGFGSGNPNDSDEIRYGKIANPTVHIGLNQIRTVVNCLVKKYGNPCQIVVELARELKQTKKQKQAEVKRNSENQRQNENWSNTINNDCGIELSMMTSTQKRVYFQKMRLWTELGSDIANRFCPYTGERITVQMLFSDQVEIEHILPYSQTLDNTLNNKTVCLRRANRDKGNRTPYEAFGKSPTINGHKYDYVNILENASKMNKVKGSKFGVNGYQNWLKDNKDFLARALNDTRYLSRIAREYLTCICPKDNVWVIPGALTAMIRAKCGLNQILESDSKNRNDHRHHAIDACVIGITDRSFLQKVANANATNGIKSSSRIIEKMPLPWPNFRETVAEKINSIKVSHKPNRGHQGQFLKDTAIGIDKHGEIKQTEGKKKKHKLIKICDLVNSNRHGTLQDGTPRPYKGYESGGNYCIDIYQDGKIYKSEVISRFDAYQIVRVDGEIGLSKKTTLFSNKTLLMRLMIDDFVMIKEKSVKKIYRVVKIRFSGIITFVEHHEANVNARNNDKEDPFKYFNKTVNSLMKLGARHVTISPIGEVNVRSR